MLFKKRLDFKSIAIGLMLAKTFNNFDNLSKIEPFEFTRTVAILKYMKGKTVKFSQDFKCGLNHGWYPGKQ